MFLDFDWLFTILALDHPRRLLIVFSSWFDGGFPTARASTSAVRVFFATFGVRPHGKVLIGFELPISQSWLAERCGRVQGQGSLLGLARLMDPGRSVVCGRSAGSASPSSGSPDERGRVQLGMSGCIEVSHSRFLETAQCIAPGVVRALHSMGVRRLAHGTQPASPRTPFP